MLNLAVRSYCRPFRKPLRTHHGWWEKREGLILRLQDDQGYVGFGEIAPIPWFGTETLNAAKTLCAQWPPQFLPATIAAIPDTLPACQFGFGSALRSLEAARDRVPRDSFGQGVSSWTKEPGPWMCALLPAGEAVLDAWLPFYPKGHRTFKWKIGVAPLPEELQLFQTLIKVLPADTRLRLDANGGLTPDMAKQWLIACDAAHNKVEFLEQPLPPDSSLNWVIETVNTFQTAIALDESVATIKQLRQVCQHLQNRVIYVVKPVIAGFPEQLYALCTQYQLDVVFSSALETSIGYRAALHLAQDLWNAGVPRHALGFGVGHWFQDDWETLTEADLFYHC
ncbi:MAG: o-succinylbenzoate synthase [Cyanobacteria bacterium P01_F01_bin.86]